MTAPNRRLVSPRDIARILFRHWHTMALFFCVTLALTFVVIAVYPRSYSSEAKLFVRVGRESVSLDPTATTGETIMLQKTQADEINSSLNLLGSRGVLEQVVERIGAKRIIEDRPASVTKASDADSSVGVIRGAVDYAGSCVVSVLSSLRLMDPGSETDLAVRGLEKRIAVSAPKESTVITISYSAKSPELAHDVVESIAQVFLEEHVRLGQTDGSLEFFSMQADKLHGELTAAQAELRDRKSRYHLTAPKAVRLSIREKTNEALRQKLYELQLQESELAARYTDLYPPLIEVRRQRGEAAKLLSGLSSTSSVGDEKTTTGGAADTTAGMRPAQTDVDVAALNEQEFELAQLERSVELLEGKYRMHVEKLEQARVNDALGRERISNVKIAQPATLVRKPDSPKKALVLGAGLFFATFGAVGLAFLLEEFDQTLRTTDQVETQLGLPVLLSLPERRKRKRRPASANGLAANGHANGDGSGRNGHAHLANYGALVRELLANGSQHQNVESNLANGNRHARAVGIVGCDSSKQRSRVAADLAIQAASTGSDSVLLIDADARRRRVTKRFHINGSPGWREVLSGTVAPDSCVHRQEPINLAVMSPGAPNGHSPGATARPIAGPSGPLNDIKNDYSLVVVDLPPESEMDAQSPSSEWLDETVLVVEAERTRIQSAQRACEMLERAGVHVMGVVLANRREHVPRWLYQRL